MIYAANVADGDLAEGNAMVEVRIGRGVRMNEGSEQPKHNSHPIAVISSSHSPISPQKLKSLAKEEDAGTVVVSAQVEAELCELDNEERADFLESLGVSLENSGLRALVSSAFDLLGLITYYTSGPTETRAWTIRNGWTAPKAAGVIHNDFERGFIRAETFSYDDLVKHGDEAGVKAAGLMRSEGKDYIVKDSDVMLFRFNV
jgi:ribosome-binding ATPase